MYDEGKTIDNGSCVADGMHDGRGEKESEGCGTVAGWHGDIGLVQ